MLTGMGIVFLFLIILVIMIKLIPIISKKRQRKSETIIQKVVSSQKSLKIKKVTKNRMHREARGRDQSRTIAAIAAALTVTTGKPPRKLVVTTPEGEITKAYNSWSLAGRQDLMEVGNLQGQRGFQY